MKRNKIIPAFVFVVILLALFLLVSSTKKGSHEDAVIDRYEEAKPDLVIR